MDRRGRLAFVPPRFGDDVVGGSELVMRELAEGLARRGWQVEILTTCARDHFSWDNEYPAGVSEEAGCTVRRFPAVVSTPRADRQRIGAVIHAGGRVPLREQERWANDDLRVPELYHYLLDHAHEYRVLAFAPYLFWTTYACGTIAPDRTLLLPMLHDEPEAALELFRPLFRGARAHVFQSEPERALALRLHPGLARTAVIGNPMRAPRAYDPERFRKRFELDAPFVHYAGRREGGKNWEWLLDAFAEAHERATLPFQLVTMGVGDVRPPRSIADRVVDLGFLTDSDRDDAFAAADVYVQPSALESFSRTIMEAWLAGTLVAGNAASDVVAWHCERSGAGLLFRDAYEFEQCLRFAAAEPAAAAAIAARGRRYVLANYAEEHVLDKFEACLDDWFPPTQDEPCAS